MDSIKSQRILYIKDGGDKSFFDVSATFNVILTPVATSISHPFLLMEWGGRWDTCPSTYLKAFLVYPDPGRGQSH